MSSTAVRADCAAPGAAPAPASTGPVRIEPLALGDVVSVQQVFAGLGPRSRELRFLTAKPRLTSADLHALSDVDGRDRVALVARYDGCAIGIARFVRDDDDPASADVAVTVVDAWQDRWIGTRLAYALVEQARELGVNRFTMSIAHDNEAAVRLMHKIADDVTRVGRDGESMDFVASLGETPPRASADPRGARAHAVLKGARA